MGLDPGSADDRRVLRLAIERELESVQVQERRAGRAGEVITDFNMLTEYRHAGSR
ncbi:hypothetical protein H1235_04005 [Pseudoxanthomonas sp. NC8]|nr:hypothetical protein H1235_04005 [Pseudoxanthomonas sp. NC8]